MDMICLRAKTYQDWCARVVLHTFYTHHTTHSVIRTHGKCEQNNVWYVQRIVCAGQMCSARSNMRSVTPLYELHDSFTDATKVSHTLVRFSRAWHDSSIGIIHTSDMTRVIHMSDMTHTLNCARTLRFRCRGVHQSLRSPLVAPLCHVPWHVRSHGTHVNESRHTCEWVMAHTWMSRVSYMDGSCPPYECGKSKSTSTTRNTPFSRPLIHVHKSWQICEWILEHTWMSHISCMNESYMNESCHTYECEARQVKVYDRTSLHFVVTSPDTCAWVLAHSMRMSHVTCMNESWHTMNESCHTYE